MPRSRAHREVFPLRSSSRTSSARPGSAPGDVGGWGGWPGEAGGAQPPARPWTAPALPPQQYSRSRRHWLSRTCPPLHTCPREQVSRAWGCPRGSHGAAIGQGGVLPARRGWGVAAAPQTPGVPVGGKDAPSVPPVSPLGPWHPTEPHSPAPQAAAGRAGLGRARWAPAASRAPAQPGGRRGLRGSRSAPAPQCAGPAGCVPTAAPRPWHLWWHQERGVTPVQCPLGVPLCPGPPCIPSRPSPAAWVPWEKGHRVARGGSWVSGQTWRGERGTKGFGVPGP